ncbi:cation:proton antiporter [Citricoccus zhacaiensis]|uniref:Cation:proton antiporter n=1 Tax=Citricoccus zhacaiensis TaxID=489142 RepID=A0ABQ2LYW1_9MICC|nr:cation:proton antiporter subunit C [Citricoccus zhacaiensis]GGO44856.1 cation:proton antiporter [Citricoccus zhacaiensis]
MFDSTFVLAITVGVLTTAGVWLLQQRDMVRAIFGLTLISHSANLLLLASGVPGWRHEPLMDGTTAAEAADPLPQAFVLTAIVIAMATTILMLALAVIGRNDDQESAPTVSDNDQPDNRPDAQPDAQPDSQHESQPDDQAASLSRGQQGVDHA